jgi:transposase
VTISAGKRKKTAARKGNPHLRPAMAGAAWACSRTASRAGPGSGGSPAGSVG